MDVIFRRATAEDWAAVYELICEMENNRLPEERFARIFKSRIQDPMYCFLVAEYRGWVIAVLNMRLEEQLHHPRMMAEATEFAVAPEYRSLGIGSRMFRWACEIARESGCMQLELSCNRIRTEAHRFYFREGMGNNHLKFSLPLDGTDDGENKLGR